MLATSSYEHQATLKSPKPSKPSLIFSSSMNLTQLNPIDPNHIKLNALLL
jgi:hypothetical protein